MSRAQDLTQERSDIDYLMEEATGLNDEERERMEFLRAEIKQKTEELGAIKRDLERSRSLKERLQIEIKQIHSDIRKQEKAVALSQRAREKVDLARDLRHFFNVYKERML